MKFVRLLMMVVTTTPLAMPAVADDATLTQAQTMAAAVLPLPEQMRAGAGVVVLDDAGQPSALRESANGMVCIADKPGDDEFDVRCYQHDFIAVVYRARQLHSGEKVAAEIKAGKLTLSEQPSAGYRCLGPISGYGLATNTMTTDIECWQSIHFPFRTAAEIGLSDEAELSEAMQRQLPYVMSSGRYWSHVMIRHPAAK